MHGEMTWQMAKWEGGLILVLIIFLGLVSWYTKRKERSLDEFINRHYHL